MANLHRNPFAAILLIIAIIIFSTIALPRALGQEADNGSISAETSPPEQTLTVSPQPDEPTPQPGLTTTEKQNTPSGPMVPVSIGDHCNPDFWLVSSRACSQRGNRCGASCDFDYIRRTADDCLSHGDKENFLASLQPGVPVCIVIHGSFTPEDSVVAQSDEVYRWIRAAMPEMPLHVVFYTWPSQSLFTHSGGISIFPAVDAVILGQRGGFNGLYLAQLIGEIPSQYRISLFGHSHGARMISAALHLLAGGQIQGHSLQGCGEYENRIRAVFAAAAIDHNWLNPGSRYGQALHRSECLLNLKNRYDLALAFYPLRKPFSHRSLARAGFTRGDRRKMGWLSSSVAELDVSDIVGSGHMIPNYTKHPGIACSIAPYLYYSDEYEQPTKAKPEPATVMK